MRLKLIAQPDVSPAKASGLTLAGQAYELIKRDLCEFRMLPGDEFTELELVTRLGVSRTPVRQALYRLEHEGFVLLRQHSGWRVRPFDVERFEALYDVRFVLEQASVTRLCGLQNIEDIHELGALKRFWLVPPEERLRNRKVLAEYDEAFHYTLVGVAGNPEMAGIHHEINEKIRIIRQLNLTKDYSVDACYQEHSAILRAIFAHRTDEAIRMLKSHIDISKAEIREITLHRLQALRQMWA